MTSPAPLTDQERAAVEPWINAHVPSLIPPLKFDHLSGGHSNITLRVRDSRGSQAVLRRPPKGDLPRGSHDVVREARTVVALASTEIPVPTVLAVCEDRSVLGVPFSLSAWVEGHVVASPADADRVLASTAARECVTKALIRALASLHLLDPVTTLATRSADPEPYLQRQLRRLCEVWESVKTRDLPAVEQLHQRLCDARPPERYTGVVHADYRLGNCMVSQDGSLRAVLDWELSTVGDVLADLSFLLNNWESASPTSTSLWMQVPPSQAGRFPLPVQLLAWYGERTGFDLRDMDYYQAFGWWRMAIIGEGIKRRHETGAMGRPGVPRQDLGQRVHDLAGCADRLLRRFEN